MLEEKYIELVNKKIDGHLSAEEEHLLASYLETNPTARAYYKDLKQSMDLLENLNEFPECQT